jgi:hypothetical protein
MMWGVEAAMTDSISIFQVKKSMQILNLFLEISNKYFVVLKIKTTAPRIPAWSPTVVLTRQHSG